jgi:hypothetical protein
MAKVYGWSPHDWKTFTYEDLIFWREAAIEAYKGEF